MEGIRLISRHPSHCATGTEADFSAEVARTTRRFHESMPAYEMTPLIELPNLAAHLGVGAIQVKDESGRLGLGSFKGLGGSYAIARIIGERLGLDSSELTFDSISNSEAHVRLNGLTLITATDGNHGRGVAWTAQQLGCPCRVLLPRGTSLERLHAIQELGAEATITEVNYDDTVRMAVQLAGEYGWELVQDTSWNGYERVPKLIMQGYTTMASEICDQLGDAVPTHVFLQAGVGAMAGAVTGYLAARYGERLPVITIVEPLAAGCIFRTAQVDDGQLHGVSGDLSTMMAGLACGEPCYLGWELLKAHASHYAVVPDEAAALGMRVLGNPLRGDRRIISGESGAATMGFVVAALLDRDVSLRNRLGIDSSSRLLCISTEGDTDSVNYRRVVWGL